MPKADLPSISAVDIGLRTRILGLKAEFRNQEYAAKIDALIDSDDILPPPEGCFSDLLHDTVLASIQNLGYQRVWVADEFCAERKLYWIDDLKGQEAGPTSGHCNVFTPDKALLWRTHWDSHFSFLCSSQANLDALLRHRPFEGFFCDPYTQVYWSVWPSTSEVPGSRLIRKSCRVTGKAVSARALHQVRNGECVAVESLDHLLKKAPADSRQPAN